MQGVAVDDQKHAPPLPRQTLQEADEDRHSESLAKDHEAQVAAVADGRDHVAAESLARTGYHRRGAAAAIAGAGLMVAAQPDLVAPQDFGLFGLGAAGHGRGILFSPPLSS